MNNQNNQGEVFVNSYVTTCEGSVPEPNSYPMNDRCYTFVQDNGGLECLVAPIHESNPRAEVLQTFENLELANFGPYKKVTIDTTPLEFDDIVIISLLLKAHGFHWLH